jgi:hypothetical protein
MKKTNAERIREMNNEELAEWLDSLFNQERDDWNPIGCFNCCNYGTHHYPKNCGDCEWKDGILAWLDKPYKEGEK